MLLAGVVLGLGWEEEEASECHGSRVRTLGWVRVLYKRPCTLGELICRVNRAYTARNSILLASTSPTVLIVVARYYGLPGMGGAREAWRGAEAAGLACDSEGTVRDSASRRRALRCMLQQRRQWAVRGVWWW